MNVEVAKAAHAKRMFEQRATHIGHLPAQILLDLARNEAATRDWRKAAVELLIDKGFPQANHPDLAGLVMEINAERAAKREVEAVVESAIEDEVRPFAVDDEEITSDAAQTGPFRASVTADTIGRDDVVEN